MNGLWRGVVVAVVCGWIGTGQAASAEAPSEEQVRGAIQEYVQQITEEEGDFAIEDEVTGNLRTLTLDRVQESSGKIGDAYHSCVDMKDVDTGETMDIDFDVEPIDGELDVVDVRIHKVNGTERYTYKGDEIVPVGSVTEPEPSA
jgi:hypothetical protein